MQYLKMEELLSQAGGSLKDDFAPLVALHAARRSERAGQNQLHNSTAPHDSIGMLVEFGEQTTDEAGEPINGNAQEFYPKLNLTASLYDACMKRGKSENIDVAVSDGQEAINASELDLSYYTTPLLAKSVNSGSSNRSRCRKNLFLSPLRPLLQQCRLHLLGRCCSRRNMSLRLR